MSPLPYFLLLSLREFISLNNINRCLFHVDRMFAQVQKASNQEEYIRLIILTNTEESCNEK